MVNPVFVDNVPPAKSSARAFLAYVVGSADVLRATDMQGSWVVYVQSLDGWFERDASDTISPDNGQTIIVGPNGERWKTSVVQVGGIVINATGPTEERDLYDNEEPPFVFYDTTAELAYIKLSAASGDWSDGIPLRGPTGATGSTGATGAAGPPNVLSIGTVTEGEADATITGTSPTQTLNLVIPRGPKGDGLQIDAAGDTAGRSAFDAEAQGFTYLDTEAGLLYVKASNDPGDWATGVPFGGVNGPGTTTDHALVRWDGTTGANVQDTPEALLSDNGDLRLGADALAANLEQSQNTEAGYSRMWAAMTGGLRRWAWGASDEVEDGDTGSPDQGSNWLLVRYNDAGEVIGNAIRVARETGYTTLVRAYEGANRVLSVVGGLVLTGGFAGTSTDLGNSGTSTQTPVFTTNNLYRYTNTGAHNLAAPSGEGTMIVMITNSGSAGAITPTGFDDVDGDDFDTTNGSIFKCYIDCINGVQSIMVKKVN